MGSVVAIGGGGIKCSWFLVFGSGGVGGGASGDGGSGFAELGWFWREGDGGFRMGLLVLTSE